MIVTRVQGEPVTANWDDTIPIVASLEKYDGNVGWGRTVIEARPSKRVTHQSG